MTLSERITQLVNQHGSLRAAARVVEIDASYLCRLGRGAKVRPGKKLLRRLGVQQVITYELTKKG